VSRRHAPVAIDARAAARRELGGVERMAREMAARLPRLRPGRYAVLRPPAALTQRAGHLWEQALLPLATRRSQAIYCPANAAPILTRRIVLVIHDLAALRHPEWYSAQFAIYHRHVLPRLAHRALRLITPSEFSRRELADAVGIDPERVAVVPNGVDERFSPAADPEPVRRAYALERPYVLLVGTRIARKNLGALAAARRRLGGLGVELVSAGSGRHWSRQTEATPVRPLGYVADDQLPGLYAGAAALAMPSLYEGFGLPVLEAMASGVPVVAADQAALTETCGTAALLVNPDDGDALAAALATAATDDAVRAKLVAAGLERASRFTWDRAAAATDAVIEGVLEE
jgi:glycosyltransferase involved in cell wall biosynthesis